MMGKDLQRTSHIIKASDPALQIALNIYSPPVTHSPTTEPNLVLICAHANSVCKEIWEPILARLFSSHPALAARVRSVYAWDARNHGDSALLNRGNENLNKLHHYDWMDSARDALEVVKFAKTQESKRAGGFQFVAIGHSFGATQLLGAEIIQPHTFSAIIAAEPMIFPKTFFIDPATGEEVLPDENNNPWTQGAMRRKAVFESRQDMESNLRSKAFYKPWDQEILQIYMDKGFVETTDGKLSLKCTNNNEASVFLGSLSTVFVYDRLPQLKTPVLFLTGRRSDFAHEVYPAPTGESVIKDVHLAGRVPGARHEWIDKAGHMVPLENVQGFVDACANFLQRALSHQIKNKL
ncbi:Alpha/Beta hydrolase protein [Phlyctochytrium arcticum]|nr:Alpha/Beta hydrolase protein [Phlyctochytrium arcticum]